MQIAVCQFLSGGILYSGVELECRERSVSVYVAVYCLDFWYRRAENGMSGVPGGVFCSGVVLDCRRWSDSV